MTDQDDDDMRPTRAVLSSNLSNLMERARAHPEGLLLLLAGCALVAGVGRRATRKSLDEMARSGAAMVADKAAGLSRNLGDAGVHVTQMAEMAAERAAASASSLQETVSSYAHHASSYAQAASEQATSLRQSLPSGAQLIQQAREPVQDAFVFVTEDQPLAMGVLALAAGALIGASLPGTQLEDNLFGPLRERALEAASKAAREQLDRLRKARDAASEKLKEEAQERGLTPEGLKSLAEDVTDAARQAASGEGSSEKRSHAKAKSGAGAAHH